uniref:orotate phosphoribosyltransferase n=1 Tax=Schistocephalus solidus TaxID=70667 RepID=A0A0V0J335_SCHSO
MMAAPVPSCPTLDEATRRDLIYRLFRLGALNFEGVQLKSGEISPVYFDIRLTMSDPALLEDLATHLWNMVSKLGGPHFDLVSGVPAAAIPLATCIALKTKIPMILCRKAAKDYGTKKVIEGIWKKGQHCLVVEDVVTYGDSVAETTDLLRANGLIVNHAVVVVERQQGATQNLAANRNVKLHALLTFNDLLMTLLNDGCISEERVQAAKSYNAKWQFNSLRPAASLSDVHFSPDIGQLLFQYMKTKCSRLCLTFDSPAYAEEIISLAERLAPKLCALMLHPELVPDFSPDFTDRLRLLANRKGFLLIADRKLADVGKITRHQLIGGQFRLADWCDLLTVHALTGTDQLAALRKLKQSAQQSTSLSALIVGEIDTEGSLIDLEYKSHCVKLAIKYSDVVLGFLSTKPLSDVPQSLLSKTDLPRLFYFVPDTHLNTHEQNVNDLLNLRDILHDFHQNSNGVLLCLPSSRFEGCSDGLFDEAYSFAEEEN